MYSLSTCEILHMKTSITSFIPKNSRCFKPVQQVLLLYGWDFSPAARALTGFFEVTRHLTVRVQLLPAKSFTFDLLTSGNQNFISLRSQCFQSATPREALQLRFSGNKINFPRDQVISCCVEHGDCPAN